MRLGALCLVSALAAHQARATALQGNPAQLRLSPGREEANGGLLHPSGLPSVIKQNETLCDAGAPQWTGTVPLGKDRDMFFWYFESRSKADTAPLIVWLNGGPGASSMLGALFEIGPCSVLPGATGTTRNPDSWSNFANLLFIDQPIGVGLSRPEKADLWSRNLLEAGVDFDKFMDIFLNDLFPNLQNNELHFAGESFGGKYVPVYASLMRRKLDSIILVDPLVDFSSSALGIFDHFCPSGDRRTESHSRYFNTTTCEEMQEPAQRCQRMGSLCQASYDPFHCLRALKECLEIRDFYFREVKPGGRHPQDDRRTCSALPRCGDPGEEDLTDYLNLPRVQLALGFENKNFNILNDELNDKWSQQADVAVPSTREIASLLDSKHVPVLVINGNNDVVINTEGITRVFDSMPWSHMAAFRSQDLQPYYYRNSTGSIVKGGTQKTAGNLTLATIDGAGHLSPHDQPEAVSHILKRWLKNIAL